MAARIRLSMSLGDYDINRPLIDGTVTPQGIDAVVLVQQSPQRHWRMLLHGEFDVCELSLGSYVAMVSRGDRSLVAIPVFPHRRFRHSYVFVNAGRDINTAEDLLGGRIGVRSWQVTGGVWMRGFLAEYHGLGLDTVTWVAQDPDDIELTLPDGIRLERVGEGQKVTDLCAAGDLDALVYPEIPEQVHAGTGELRRLFSDPREAEESYYRETGIFPIMHVVVVKREVLDAHPWVARNLVDAFQQSKADAVRRMRDPRVVSLAWLRWLVEHERQILGPDPWMYGLGDANRNNLETFLRYAVEQGVAARKLEVDELFFESVREEPPHFV